MSADEELVGRILGLAEEFYRVGHYSAPREWWSEDLTMPQLRVLLTLFNDGPCHSGALAEALGVSLPTTTGILARLQRRGLIVRSEDPADRRRVISQLTDSGQELMQRLWASGQDWLARLLRGMSRTELAGVEQALVVLIDALKRQEEALGHGVAHRHH